MFRRTTKSAGLMLVGLLLSVSANLQSQVVQAQDDVALRAMKDEMARSMAKVQLAGMEKPYFIAYRMDDINQTNVSATLGSLTQERPLHFRLVGIELRVGNYALDNTNFVPASGFAGGLGGALSNISQGPLDDNYQQIRRVLWMATDTQYKKALETLSAKRAVLEMRQHTDDLPDFTKTAPVVETQAPPAANSEIQALQALARQLSAVFKEHPEIYNSGVDLEFRNYYTRYINSEGSSFTRSQPIAKLQINAETQANDGTPMSDSMEIFGRSISDFPAQQALLERTRGMADRLAKLRTAASVETYNGPVLFEGEAASEIFAQQFAGGLVAVRQPLSDDPRFEMFFTQIMARLGAESFTDKIGGRVLPEFLSVADNPTLRDYQGAKLLGWHSIDDDAVPARETRLVEHGILKTLLNTRVPVRSVRESTGSRRGWSAVPSNLIVTAEKSMSEKDLRDELLRRAKERGLDYGIVVRHVGGGGLASLMRMASSMMQQGEEQGSSLAEVYKVYPDGREELLRGMQIAEMTSASFKDIVAAGDKPVVFTDEFMPRLGAFFSEGSALSDVPVVSFVSPSLLFEEISLKTSPGPFPNPPILPSPLAASK